jgi:hypothetical protein
MWVEKRKTAGAVFWFFENVQMVEVPFGIGMPDGIRNLSRI